MNRLSMLLLGAAALSAPLSAQEANDSVMTGNEKELSLDEVVVVAGRKVLRQEPDRIVYLVRNDRFAAGLNAFGLLDRMPRVSVIDDRVSVAGKNSVRYIVDGHLLEMTDEALAMKLKNLQSEGIEKIELLTTPPARYAAGNNVAYISITTRNESLGTRGNVWGRGRFSDSFGYSLGGNISHTTRRVEISGDAGWNDSHGKNDQYNEYVFADRTQVSERRNSFTWRTLSANGLFKYKFGTRLSAGVILNYGRDMMRSDLTDRTVNGEAVMLSTAYTPCYPDNALTLTGFADWNIDSSGKTLSLTYNWFDKRSNAVSEVESIWDSTGKSGLTRDAGNRYDIHSVKLDATLPFGGFKMESGAAYTYIGNNTDLVISRIIDEKPVYDHSQSNNFVYDEKTAAAYVSAEKSIGMFFGKIGLRYEHTDVDAVQKADNSSHSRSYDYLLPSAVVSLNLPGAGRLSADYSMGISRPGFGDLNPFRYYNTVNDYFTGNPNLESVVTHNAGINYSFKGLYAVLYGSWNRNAIGYITRFGEDGMKSTTPENCLDSFKTGLYASYNRSLFGWWNINVGGEVFYSATKSKTADYRYSDENGWSGKLELNTSWMLNRAKSLILNLRCSHFFPYHDRMTEYDSRTLLNCELRYMLLDNRLTLSASVTDPFGWSITRSHAYFKDYSLYSRTNIHQHSVAVRISYSFGGRKVNNVYRDTKERESRRSY